MDSRKQERDGGTQKLSLIAFSCAIVFLFAWVESFHGFGRDAIVAISWHEGLSAFFRLFKGLHCPAQSLGLATGFAAFLVMRNAKWKKPKSSFGDSLFVCSALAMLLLTILHFVSTFLFNAPLLSSAIHFCVNVFLAIVVADAVDPLFRSEAKVVFLAVASGCAGSMLADLSAAMVGTLGAPSFVCLALQVMFLLLSCFSATMLRRWRPMQLSNSESLSEFPCERDAAKTKAREHHNVEIAKTTRKSAFGKVCTKMGMGKLLNGDVKPALGLHLFMYGLVLGFLHIIGGRLAYGANFRTESILLVIGPGDLTLVVGSALALLVVAVLYIRGNYRFSVFWNTMEKVVFTLSVLEFLLVPLMTTSFPAVIAGNCASSLYLMLFFLGVWAISKESDYSASLLIATGGALLFGGRSISSLICQLSLNSLATDSELFAILRVVAFLLCTAATFWLGTEKDVEKMWGLRRNYTPKRYHDIILQQKCEFLANAYSLTQREREVITLIAQGMRSEQIAKALYISTNTVRTHIQNAYGKLDIHSVKDLESVLSDVSTE